MSRLYGSGFSSKATRTNLREPQSDDVLPRLFSADEVHRCFTKGADIELACAGQHGSSCAGRRIARDADEAAARASCLSVDFAKYDAADELLALLRRRAG